MGGREEEEGSEKVGKISEEEEQLVPCTFSRPHSLPVTVEMEELNANLLSTFAPLSFNQRNRRKEGRKPMERKRSSLREHVEKREEEWTLEGQI